MKGKQLSFDFEEVYRSYPDEETDLKRKLGDYLNGKKFKITFTDNSSTMISFRTDPRRVLIVRLHHMFREATPDVLQALAKYINHQRDTSRGVLDRFFEKNKALIKQKQPRKQSLTLKTKGEHFDLGALYDMVNSQYFASTMDVKVSWGKNSKGAYNIRLGSYNLEDNLMRIHPSLDSKKVPCYFVESIIYHELCHAAVGVKSSHNGRTLFHTREFNELEKQFKHFEKAAKWERKNLGSLFK